MLCASEIDMWVGQSFDVFIDRSQSSKVNTLLHEIAIEPAEGQEGTIENMFLDSLKYQPPQDVVVEPQRTETYNDRIRIHDIVGEYMSEVVMVVEVKSPFTDQNGIKFHTRKGRTLTKDANALLAALRNGVICTYELITLYECYPVDTRGNIVILKNGIRSNQKAVKETYGIHWPTRKDYDYGKGEADVDCAMGKIADKLGLRAERVKGWKRVELTGARSDVRAYLDCALFKMATLVP